MTTVLDQDTQSLLTGCSHSGKLAGVISDTVHGLEHLRAQGPEVGVGLGRSSVPGQASG